MSHEKIHWLIYVTGRNTTLCHKDSELTAYEKFSNQDFTGKVEGNPTIRTRTLKPVIVTAILNLLQNGKNWRWLKIRVERKIDHAVVFRSLKILS